MSEHWVSFEGKQVTRPKFQTEFKYVKHLTNDELLERIAEELVTMHQETSIDLGYWETGREIVERFYHLDVQLTLRGRRVESITGGKP